MRYAATGRGSRSRGDEVDRDRTDVEVDKLEGVCGDTANRAKSPAETERDVELIARFAIVEEGGFRAGTAEMAL
jgi:hypothetical protein